MLWNRIAALFGKRDNIKPTGAPQVAVKPPPPPNPPGLRHIWNAPPQQRRSSWPFVVQQLDSVAVEAALQACYALQRAEKRLQREADLLHVQGDYSAEFAAEDAERMREVIAWLRRSLDRGVARATAAGGAGVAFDSDQGAAGNTGGRVERRVVGVGGSVTEVTTFVAGGGGAGDAFVPAPAWCTPGVAPIASYEPESSSCGTTGNDPPADPPTPTQQQE